MFPTKLKQFYLYLFVVMKKVLLFNPRAGDPVHILPNADPCHCCID